LIVVDKIANEDAIFEEDVDFFMACYGWYDAAYSW
jgi:hypothetical protein